MQPQNKQFLEALDWDNHLRDGDTVDGEGRDVDEMLSILGSITEERLDQYRENQEFTQPAEERRQARQDREYKLDQLPGKPQISGS